MSDLKSGKEEFVPSDGWILAASEVEFTEGESVHDVLQRVCKDAGIQMESSLHRLIIQLMWKELIICMNSTADSFLDGCIT